MKLKKILENSFSLQPKEANQKLEIYKCKYCGQTYARHITRMSIHLLKCSGCPAAVRELLQEKVKGKILESSKQLFNKKGQIRNLKKILEENFQMIPRDGSQKLDIFKCKHCEQKYARNASRMSLHLQKCSDCPVEVKEALEANVRGNNAHKVSRRLIPKKVLESSFILQPKEPNQKLQTFKCKYCGQVYARHSTRMSIHLQKCIGCPGSIKDSLSDKSKSKRDQKKIDIKRRNSESEDLMSDEENNTSIMQMSSDNIYFNESANETNFIDRMTKQRQRYCEELLAKAIYASNTPISIIDNDHWRTLLNTLSPAFQLPTQHQLSTTLLETTYESVKKSIDQKVRDAISLGLQCSYRSNARNEGIIQFVLTTPDPVLYKSISLSSNAEDENLYLEKISEVIDEVGAERVLGVCLDSLTACENLYELLQQKYEEHNIAFYNCSSQTLDRLLSVIDDRASVITLVKNASAVIKEIKQFDVIASLLSEAQKSVAEKNQDIVKLKVLGNKKWSSSLICLYALYEIKENLQLLVSSPKVEGYINKGVKELITDEEFWSKLNSYTKLIRPIIKWIVHLNIEEAKISEVPEVFADLEQHFLTEFQESSLLLMTVEESNRVLERFKTLSSAVLQPIHFAANILNPLLKGEHLSSPEFVLGTEMISKLPSKFGMPENDVLVDLANYSSGKGVWSVNFVKRSITLMPPSTWWNGFFKNSFLTKIAAAILDLPSTSLAPTDRVEKRISLKDDPTGKIMYISQNLRLLDPKRTEKNNKCPTEVQEKIEQELMMEDIEGYNEEMEEVLVEDPEEVMDETEEITGDPDSTDMREVTGDEANGEVYIQIIDGTDTFYVENVL
ncbi:uncharacterized protein LOC131671525 [Phymastichus coffea]|uniref:uncharacterized protein LOC131671525 n=1 Tax=Phymastichus coffea TaxID=108790 RepID=UPI00273AFD3C|nr:uncharacterized protein LOC131671525 [Phymastichus coffea]